MVPLCETGSKASSALLQTAKQQVPQQQRAWASSKSSVVKVRSWDQLVEAAGQHDGAASAVFELQQGPFTATSTLQLKPGMAVLGSNKDKVKITCGKAVGSAVEVDLRGEGSPPRWVSVCLWCVWGVTCSMRCSVLTLCMFHFYSALADTAKDHREGQIFVCVLRRPVAWPPAQV